MHHGKDARGDLLNASLLTPINPASLPRFQSGRTSAATPALTQLASESIKWNSDQPNKVEFVSTPRDDGEVIFDHLVKLKLASADFAVHLDNLWRAGLFQKLDDLLDADEWDFTHEMPSLESFKSFLRMIVHSRVTKRPSLGATSDGKIVASWRAGDGRLVVECLSNDDVRWVASRQIDGKPVSAAGTSPVAFLRTALQPYGPEIWFG